MRSIHRNVDAKSAAGRNDNMPGKITMINVVWMAMVTGMLTATIALYDQKVDTSKVYGPYASARAAVVGQY
jgi:hypothetical protein